MAAFDACFLMLLLDPDSKPPTDPATGAVVTQVRERIEFLIKTLERDRTKVIIPTPALSELLIRADAAGPDYLDVLSRSARFEIAPFDTRAAIEVAAVTRDAITKGDKKSGSLATWQKVKFDRQVVAIAKVHGAKTVYSDDGNIRTFASHAGLRVVTVADLPLPPEEAQPNLFTGNTGPR